MSKPATPTVSVITVCFNSAATLAEALQSVVEQTWPGIEHIVIDGRSSDHTPDILAKFKPHLAHVVSEPDAGIYDAMNKGLSLCRGDIVCFLNADDRYASPQVIADVAARMVEHRLDVVMGDVAFFHPDNPHKMVRRYRSDRFRPELLAYGWMPAHPALFVRREAVARVGKFKTSYRIAGDFDFVARLFADKSLRYRHVPEVLVHMRTGGASTAGLRAKLLLNREVLRACRENGIRTNMLKILSKYPAKLLEMVVR